MQIGLCKGLVDAGLIGPKGAAALQDQCNTLERRSAVIWVLRSKGWRPGMTLSLCLLRACSTTPREPVLWLKRTLLGRRRERVVKPSFQWAQCSFTCDSVRR